jgi:hypothetical protein
VQSSCSFSYSEADDRFGVRLLHFWNVYVVEPEVQMRVSYDTL